MDEREDHIDCDCSDCEQKRADINYGGCLACVHGSPHKHTREGDCSFARAED